MPKERTENLKIERPGGKMGGNNFSKLLGITYPSPEMQKCFDNVQYIPRKFFKATSERKELTRLVMEKKLMWY